MTHRPISYPSQATVMTQNPATSVALRFYFHGDGAKSRTVRCFTLFFRS